jgi:hypothetical protein
MNRRIALLAALALLAVGAVAGAALARTVGIPKEKGVQWEIVNDQGQLIRHSKDAVSSIRATTGIYRMYFKGNLQNCALVASVSQDQNANPPAAFAGATWWNTAPYNDVRVAEVTTYNAAGTLTDLPFQLIVAC